MRRLLRRITTTGGLGAEAAAESVSDAAGSAASSLQFYLVA